MAMKYSLKQAVAGLTGNLDNVIPGYNPGYTPPSQFIQVCHPTTYCNVHRQQLKVPSMLWVPMKNRPLECPDCGTRVANVKDLEIHRKFCLAELVVSNA